MRRLLVRASVIGSLVCAAATPLVAQQGTSQISGRALDEQGGALPGATITLTNEESGAFRDVVTGADGSFSAPQLKPGRYRVTAKLQNGVLGTVKQCRDGWCRLVGEGFDGWVEQPRLWGVYPGEKVE